MCLVNDNAVFLFPSSEVVSNCNLYEKHGSQLYCYHENVFAGDVFCSSKLAAVLRKLHNANDMLQSSAYETSKPNSPNADETSVTQSSPSDNFASNNDGQQESVERSLDVHGECEKTDVEYEATAPECPPSKVRTDSSSRLNYMHCRYLLKVD